MIVTSSTDLRANMKHYFDKVVDSHETLVVTRKNDENVVVMSQATYDSLMETIYLIGDKENYDHLMGSIAQIASGVLEEHQVAEPNGEYVLGNETENMRANHHITAPRTLHLDDEAFA